jgi:hypothetical protein
VKMKLEAEEGGAVALFSLSKREKNTTLDALRGFSCLGEVRKYCTW